MRKHALTIILAGWILSIFIAGFAGWYIEHSRPIEVTITIEKNIEGGKVY